MIKGTLNIIEQRINAIVNSILRLNSSYRSLEIKLCIQIYVVYNIFDISFCLSEDTQVEKYGSVPPQEDTENQRTWKQYFGRKFPNGSLLISYTFQKEPTGKYSEKTYGWNTASTFC